MSVALPIGVLSLFKTQNCADSQVAQNQSSSSEQKACAEMCFFQNRSLVQNKSFNVYVLNFVIQMKSMEQTDREWQRKLIKCDPRGNNKEQTCGIR